MHRTSWPYLKYMVCWLVFISACTAVSDPPPRRSIPLPVNKLGIHLLLDDGRNTWPTDLWAEHIRYARQIAGEWGYVTQVIRLDDLDVAKWQLFMDLCAENHLTPILRLATLFDRDENWWLAPPVDRNGRTYHDTAKQFANFVTALNWPTEDHYVIVGNEPNHGDEWNGRPDPAAYAQFLVDTAVALKTADPGARILNAGLDQYTPHTGSQPFTNGMRYMDAETFLDEMAAAQPDVFAHLDAWASHPYPLGPFREAPWKQTFQIDRLNDAHNPAHATPPPGVYNRGVNGYEWEMWKLATHGLTDLPIFVTETGWRHSESVYDGALDQGMAYPTAVTVNAYFDLTLHGNKGRYPQYPETGWTPWLEDDRIRAITPFALNGRPDEWGHTNWLGLDMNGKLLSVHIKLGLAGEE